MEHSVRAGDLSIRSGVGHCAAGRSAGRRALVRLGALSLLVGCVGTNDPIIVEAGGSFADAASADASAVSETDARVTAEDAGAMVLSYPTREHAVVRRNCAREPFGASWLLVPSVPRGCTEAGCETGTQCARDEQCTERGRGRCIGRDTSRCAYESTPVIFDELCEDDAECLRAAGGRCIKELTYTYCMYDECVRDGDCGATDVICYCAPHLSDPRCVIHGCEGDQDCEVGKVCLRDESVQGVVASSHCTTADDECRTADECTTDPADTACGFDLGTGRWRCTGFTIVD